MAKNTTTVFPTAIDDRIFFQDINLTQVDAAKHYQELISQNKYTEASEFLNSTKIDFFGAWVLNLLEKRLVALENYIQTKTKPELTRYGGAEPTSIKTHWID